MTKKNTQSPVSKRLSKYIESTEKNVTQLARDMDIPQTSLNNIVTGRTKPSYKILLPLAEAGLNINWLLTGEGQMLRKNQEEKIINQGNLTNLFGGNNNKGISNEFNQDVSKVLSLQKEIEYLKKQLADKEKIISLLERK